MKFLTNIKMVDMYQNDYDEINSFLRINNESKFVKEFYKRFDKDEIEQNLLSIKKAIKELDKIINNVTILPTVVYRGIFSKGTPILGVNLGYTSTSKSELCALDFSDNTNSNIDCTGFVPNMYILIVNPGVKYFNMYEIEEYKGEEEILFERGLTTELLHTTDLGYIRYFTCRLYKA